MAQTAGTRRGTGSTDSGLDRSQAGQTAKALLSQGKLTGRSRSGKRKDDPNWDDLHVLVPANVKALMKGYCKRHNVRQQDFIFALMAEFFVSEGYSLRDLFDLVMPPDTTVDRATLEELIAEGATPKANTGKSAD